jgi:hypothetical protein
MAALSPSVSEPEQVFLRRDRASRNGLWLLIGGGVALAFAALGFGLALLVDVDQIALHSLTTMPVLIGIGALASGLTMLRTATQVTVGPLGLSVLQRDRVRLYPWSDIGWATVTPNLMGAGRKLVVYDPRGKAIVHLGDAFDNFDSLTELVLARVATRSDDAAARIQRSKSLRAGALSLITGLGLCAAAIGIALMTRSEIAAERLLREEGQLGTGKIVERFMAPNGRTARLRYQVVVGDRLAPERNAEVTKQYWDGLEGATRVPIVYAPSDPSVSRLAMGEVPDDSPGKNPVMGFGLAAAGGVLGLGLLGLAAMQLAGWDIDLDSKTGKVSIKRFGTGR